MDSHPKGPFTYDFPRPSVTVDIAILAPNDNQFSGRDNYCLWSVLSLRRGEKGPFANCLCMPGGFLDVLTDPSLESAAWRELEEETQLTRGELQMFVARGPVQVGAWGDMERDERGRIVTIVYGFRLTAKVGAVASDDAMSGSAKWLKLSDLPRDEEFAFDHKEIILQSAHKLLR